MSTRFLSTKRAGLTLVEVVAGLALLATLMTSVLLAHAGHVRQVRAAQQKIRAVDALDRLLVEWLSRRDGIPRDYSQPLPGMPELTVQASIVANPSAASLQAAVLRIEVREARQSTSAAPVCALELLVPEQERRR